MRNTLEISLFALVVILLLVDSSTVAFVVACWAPKTFHQTDGTSSLLSCVTTQQTRTASLRLRSATPNNDSMFSDEDCLDLCPDWENDDHEPPSPQTTMREPSKRRQTRHAREEEEEEFVVLEFSKGNRCAWKWRGNCDKINEIATWKTLKRAATRASIASASASWTVDSVTAGEIAVIFLHDEQLQTVRRPKTVPCVVLERKCAKRVGSDASRDYVVDMSQINTVKITKM